MTIYLDHAATTPLLPVARAAMEPWLSAQFAANASSVHRSGQRARAAVETARENLAGALNAAPPEIVFVSGATEADALAICGVLETAPDDAALVVSAAEHAAVLQVAAREERRGRPVIRLGPGPSGAPSPETLDEALAGFPGRVALVAVMHTNNETGVVADVPALAARAHDHGAALLCDAVQGFGFAELDVRRLGADLVAFSSHKIGGPQGVGALWIRDGVELVPQALGGAQERGRRAGTHPLAAIVGFGAAAQQVSAELAERAARTAALRDALEARVTALPDVKPNGEGRRGPKHLNVRVGGVDGESLVLALDAAGLEVSAGSACSAGSLEPSHVLMAMGLDAASARASVRFSLAPTTTEAEVAEAGERFGEVVEHLRAAA